MLTNKNPQTLKRRYKMGKKYDLSRLSIEDIFEVLSSSEDDLGFDFYPGRRGYCTAANHRWLNSENDLGYIKKKPRETYKNFLLRFLKECLRLEKRDIPEREERVMNNTMGEILGQYKN